MAENFLTEKAGPLPVWAWGVIGGGVLTVFVWMNRGGGSSDAAAAESTTGKPVPTTNPADWDYATTGNSPGYVSGSASSIVQEDDIGTNFEWLARGVPFLIAARYGGTASVQALQKYLEGRSLSSEENTMVNLWIAEAGYPPQGTGGIPGGDVELAATYFRKEGDPTGDIWLANPDGSRSYVDYGLWASLGKPKPEDVPADYSFWKRPIAVAKA